MSELEEATEVSPQEKIYASVEDLLTVDSQDDEDVDLPSGRKVRIGPLSRDQVLTGRKLVQMERITTAEWEAHMIADALLAPEMTFDQVREWQKLKGSIPMRDLRILTQAITRISGMDDGTPKSDLPDVRIGSRNGTGNAHRGKARANRR